MSPNIPIKLILINFFLITEVNVRADLCEKLIQILYYLLELESNLFTSFGRFLLDEILVITLKSLSDDIKVRLFFIKLGFVSLPLKCRTKSLTNCTFRCEKMQIKTSFIWLRRVSWTKIFLYNQ